MDTNKFVTRLVTTYYPDILGIKTMQCFTILHWNLIVLNELYRFQLSCAFNPGLVYR